MTESLPVITDRETRTEQLNLIKTLEANLREKDEVRIRNNCCSSTFDCMFCKIENSPLRLTGDESHAWMVFLSSLRIEFKITC